MREEERDEEEGQGRGRSSQKGGGIKLMHDGPSNGAGAGYSGGQGEPVANGGLAKGMCYASSTTAAAGTTCT